MAEQERNYIEGENDGAVATESPNESETLEEYLARRQAEEAQARAEEEARAVEKSLSDKENGKIETGSVSESELEEKIQAEDISIIEGLGADRVSVERVFAHDTRTYSEAHSNGPSHQEKSGAAEESEAIKFVDGKSQYKRVNVIDEIKARNNATPEGIARQEKFDREIAENGVHVSEVFKSPNGDGRMWRTVSRLGSDGVIKFRDYEVRLVKEKEQKDASGDEILDLSDNLEDLVDSGKDDEAQEGEPIVSFTEDPEQLGAEQADDKTSNEDELVVSDKESVAVLTAETDQLNVQAVAPEFSVETPAQSETIIPVVATELVRIDSLEPVVKTAEPTPFVAEVITQAPEQVLEPVDIPAVVEATDQALEQVDIPAVVEVPSQVIEPVDAPVGVEVTAQAVVPEVMVEIQTQPPVDEIPEIQTSPIAETFETVIDFPEQPVESEIVFSDAATEPLAASHEFSVEVVEPVLVAEESTVILAESKAEVFTEAAETVSAVRVEPEVFIKEKEVSAAQAPEVTSVISSEMAAGELAVEAPVPDESLPEVVEIVEKAAEPVAEFEEQRVETIIPEINEVVVESQPTVLEEVVEEGAVAAKEEAAPPVFSEEIPVVEPVQSIAEQRTELAPELAAEQPVEAIVSPKEDAIDTTGITLSFKEPAVAESVRSDRAEIASLPETEAVDRFEAELPAGQESIVTAEVVKPSLREDAAPRSEERFESVRVAPVIPLRQFARAETARSRVSGSALVSDLPESAPGTRKVYKESAPDAGLTLFRRAA